MVGVNYQRILIINITGLLVVTEDLVFDKVLAEDSDVTAVLVSRITWAELWH